MVFRGEEVFFLIAIIILSATICPLLVAATLVSEVARTSLESWSGSDRAPTAYHYLRIVCDCLCIFVPIGFGIGIYRHDICY